LILPSSVFKVKALAGTAGKGFFVKDKRAKVCEHSALSERYWIAIISV
jgi:hypothetical protein